MSPVLAAAVALAALSAGYVLGRARPARRLHAWNWDRTIHGATPSRGDQVLFVVLNPAKTLRAWGRRNEPERELAEAPQLGDHWRDRDGHVTSVVSPDVPDEDQQTRDRIEGDR